MRYFISIYDAARNLHRTILEEYIKIPEMVRKELGGISLIIVQEIRWIDLRIIVIEKNAKIMENSFLM